MSGLNEIKSWFWTEPTDEEFKRRRMTENFYRIYTVRGDGKESVLYRFWAKDDCEAYRTLEMYKKDHPEINPVYWSLSGYIISPDGKRMDTMFEDDGAPRNTLWTFIRYRIPWIVGSIENRILDALSYLFRGHGRHEYWSIDRHLVDDLRHNLPLLAENAHGYPVIMDEIARKSLKTEGKDTDVSSLALKLWKDELGRLLEHVLFYRYFSDYGVVDDGDRQMADFDRAHRSQLPVKPGTKEELDFAKLDKLRTEHWNAIWDWMKEKGEALWD